MKRIGSVLTVYVGAVLSITDTVTGSVVLLRGSSAPLQASVTVTITTVVVWLIVQVVGRPAAGKPASPTA